MVLLHSLKITQFRGIRAIDFTLNGKNASFFGPNGSGKSSVVDALDFLLTGQIQRLTGDGTGGLSLSKHGPHIDSVPGDAVVEASFTCDGVQALVTLKRCIATADQLEVLDGGTIPPSLARYLALAADSGLHLLTRRQILRFILAQPKERAEQISALLRVERLDELRVELQGAAKLANDEVKRLQVVVGDQRRGLLQGFHDRPATIEEALVLVNASRQRLGAAAVDRVSADTIVVGVPPLAHTIANPLQSQRTQSGFALVRQWHDVERASWIRAVADYIGEVRSLRDDAARLSAMRAVKLIEQGLRLTTGDSCPLCLTPWDREALRTLLGQRLVEGKVALEEAMRLDARRSELVATGQVQSARLRALATDLREGRPSTAGALERHADRVDGMILLGLPTVQEGGLPDPESFDGVVVSLSSDAEFQAEITTLAAALAGLPDLTGIQRDWDELVSAQRALAMLHESERGLATTRAAADQLTLFNTTFIRARDEVLQSVYDAIATRFAEFYKDVHQDDETAFTAKLDPTKAGLALEVGFHGRGEFPPGAVHSEGHQDSMGIFLFLALVEHVAGVSAGPIMLDDVVMSVDRDHRRGVAALLHSAFPTTQFLLTTHDRVWWHQLRSVGLVQNKNAYPLTSWTLAAGPSAGEAPGTLLAEARAYCEQNRVPSAAHSVRRITEEFGPELCDQLGAHLRYKADGSWESGEYLDGAVSRIGKLLKKGRAAAHSWGKDTTELDARIANLSAANAQLGGERWAVNASVHFNEWAELSPNDFRPVLDAFEAIMRLFFCPSCEGVLYLLEQGVVESQLRCPCGDVAINLEQKP